jgi:hypothetical protein
MRSVLRFYVASMCRLSATQLSRSRRRYHLANMDNSRCHVRLAPSMAERSPVMSRETRQRMTQCSLALLDPSNDPGNGLPERRWHGGAGNAHWCTASRGGSADRERLRSGPFARPPPWQCVITGWPGLTPSVASLDRSAPGSRNRPFPSTRSVHSRRQAPGMCPPRFDSALDAVYSSRLRASTTWT